MYVSFMPRPGVTLITNQFATELPAPEKDEPLYRNIYGPNQVRVWPT
jgi:hypothetical protein